MIFDGGSGIPNSRMYFLNTDYMELVVHKDADMTVMDEMKPYNQDAAVVPILWMGQLVCSNLPAGRPQGLINPRVLSTHNARGIQPISGDSPCSQVIPVSWAPPGPIQRYHCRYHPPSPAWPAPDHGGQLVGCR